MQLRKFIEAEGFYRIPLKKLATGHYLFSAKINGVSGNFILDTGASTSCVGFTDSAHFLLISEESIIKAAGAGAVNMETMLSRKNKFSIADWEIKNMDFVLFDLSHVNEALLQANEEAIHGIIGADFLKQHRAVIDYGRNCFYVK
ncbi:MULTISPECIES: TIGR02281 family clan AA aspartic protease [Aequorivita]|uniref:Clan AA aspartic protease n=1 Tax=Aequorivita iocasae TaxID=2803865 RepID=A0ABX7DUK4_9FLAO|nr:MULTISPECIES: retropepsin-like aspartic protease [Aequorivita]QQX77820.1 clan AA aspartic protease [Aequorivita iocasae]UCA57320.1 retroviral-like aspartic protease family protein [Aequorivita sp. F7]